MAAPAYLSTGIDADLVRLIKDGAIFIRPSGTTDVPLSASWTPEVATTQLGYYSEDGFTLSPEVGDTTELLAHNGDVVLAEQDPGFWTLAFAGIEGNQAVTAAYFDVDVDPDDGSVTVTSAASNKRYDIVTVGLDQQERVILVHYPNAQISEREGLTFNRTSLLAFGLTFRTFRGSGDSDYHFKAWGLSADLTSEDWTLQITGSPTGGTYTVIVDGTPSASIAYDAIASAVQTAINGIAGVTGATVTGTTTKAIAFTEQRVVSANGSALTGGTSPAAVTTPV